VGRFARAVRKHRGRIAGVAAVLALAILAVAFWPSKPGNNALVEEAASLEKRGDLEGALAKLREAKGADPGDASIPRKIAAIEQKIREKEEREAALDAEKRREEIRRIVEVADRLVGEGKFAEARASYARAQGLGADAALLAARFEGVEKAEREAGENRKRQELADRRARVEGYLNDARRHLRDRKAVEAQAKIQLAKELAGDDPECAKMFQQLEKDLQAMLEQSRRDLAAAVEKLLEQGDRCLDEGKLGEAMRHYVDAKGLDPANAEIHARIEECDRRVKEAAAAPKTEGERNEKREKAAPAFNLGLKKLEDALKDFYKKGADLGAMRLRLKESIDLFTKALSEDPTFAQAYHHRARAHLARYEIDAAEKDFGRAIQHDPALAAAYLGRGRILLGRLVGDVATIGTSKGSVQESVRKRAVADFQKAGDLGGLEEADVLLLRAQGAMAKGEFESSWGLTTRLIRAGTTNEEIYRARAEAVWGYLQTAPVKAEEIAPLRQQATQDCTDALRLRPNFPEVLRLRATLRLEAEAAGAIEDLEMSLRIFPDDAYARITMGAAQLKENRIAEALAEVEKGIQLAPKAWYGYYVRALARVRQQNFQAAFEDANRAIQIAPDSYAPFYLRGMIHELAKKPREALADYERSYELGPLKMASLKPKIDELKRKLGKE
jgi:tetratricopeptide (TPR) repeat protein